MNAVNIDRTVGELVAEQPGRARVFERLGIDYCCGGKRPLKVVCEEKNLPVEAVVGQLASEASPGQEETNWQERSLTELADHIEQTHHAYLKAELPRLSAMLAKVVQRHGDRHGEMWAVQEVFEQFRAELEAHMLKEEHILFPAIRQLDAQREETGFHCGSLANPIRVMEHEHDSAGEALARMNELSHGYQPPADACNTYRALLHSLKHLEADMHQHVHKENSILFPRAIAAERAKQE
ncbi:MAG TPA: iron-sulfur cluster repair di-iron protein [Tepidisphaeraceae bacterium]|nr:iron-sulfur cluster repair di-iron protein [Tepidisphaeraceae bacterium]